MNRIAFSQRGAYCRVGNLRIRSHKGTLIFRLEAGTGMGFTLLRH
jgi:hypothetical protein